MSKVEQIVDTVVELFSDDEAKKSELECIIIAASPVENILAYDTNIESPEHMAMLLYRLCAKSPEFKMAVRAVDAQIQKDKEREIARMERFPVKLNNLPS